MDTVERFNLADRRIHLPFLDDMRQQNNRRLGHATCRFFLQNSLDTDTRGAQYTRNLGQYTGLVTRLHTQIIGCLDIIHRQNRHIGQGMRLEGQVWHPVFGIGRQGAHHINNICDHGGSGWLCPGTGTVIQCWSDGIGLYQYGIHHPVYIGKQAAFGDQGRMHTQFDALVRLAGKTEVFYPVAEFLGVIHILTRDTADALCVDPVKLQRYTEGYGCQDTQLVCCIDAFYIKGRIGFRIPKFLRFLEYVRKITPLVAHLGEDEVTGTVDDAGQPFNPVGCQALANRLDDRNTTGHGRLEGHHDALLLRGCKNLVAMRCNQRLVGRHHVLAVGNCLQYQLTRRFITTDQFNNDIDIRLIDDGKGIVTHRNIFNAGHTGRVKLTCSRMTDFYTTTGTPGNLFCIAPQHVKRATTYRAEAQQANLNRIQ